MQAAASGLAPPRPRPVLERLLGRTLTPEVSAPPAAPEAPRGKTGTQLNLPWFAQPAESPEAPVELKEATATRQPILSFAGGG